MFYLVFINSAGRYKFKTKKRARYLATSLIEHARVYKTESEARKVALATMYRLQLNGYKYVGWVTLPVADFETEGKEQLKYLCEAVKGGAFDD